jgi:thiamine biosynthesis lipoprotein
MTELLAFESFPALGSQAVIGATHPEALSELRATVEGVVAEFDQACSRFRPDSELMRLNRAAGATVKVSPLLLECIQAALRAAQLSDGLVDPTVGQALVALGYDRDFAELDSAGPREISIVPVPGWRTVQIDSAAATVSVPRGVVLDLGATAKALAADRAAAAASRRVGCGVAVGLGGDFALAGAPPEPGWRIRVTDDHRSGTTAPGQWISLRSGGLATSSTSVRRWRTADGTAHHLIDPATGASADTVWRTVSVSAATCLDANIAATTAILKGHSAAAWLQAQGLPSRLVGDHGPVCHVAGWPVEGDDLAPAQAVLV